MLPISLLQVNGRIEEVMSAGTPRFCTLSLLQPPHPCAHTLTPFQGILPDQGPPDLTDNLTPKLQQTACSAKEYKSDAFLRCMSCKGHRSGDTCRFEGIRVLFRDDQGSLKFFSFVSSFEEAPPRMHLPIQWNMPVQPPHIDKTLVSRNRYMLAEGNCKYLTCFRKWLRRLSCLISGMKDFTCNTAMSSGDRER
jgi:hypothetical protein